jgi:hypothetical protein
MVNDNNDKWSDDGELPINPENSSDQPEDKYPKRKVLKNQTNDQKEMSMEELINGSRRREEQYRNMTKNGKSKEEPYRITKKEFVSSKDAPIKEEPYRTTKKEFISSKDAPIKEVTSKVPIKEVTSKDLPYEINEPIKDVLSSENQKFKDQLKKLKEEIKELQHTKDISKYIKNLDCNVGQLAVALRTFTDAKSWEATPRGELEVRRYANYYDVHSTITTAGASDPNDFDSAVYNVEKIYESLERYADIIYVTNDGTDNLYAIISHGGRTSFSTEAIIYPGNIKFYYNAYEIRLRSPTAGLPYRVSEYRISTISEISNTPIEKANIHNQALPAANTNWLTTNIVPTNSPTTFMVEVAVSIAGNFSAVVTKAGNSQVVTFNVVPGPALVAGGLYIFNVLVHSGDSVNFQYSTTGVGAIIQLLRVQELDSASA